MAPPIARSGCTRFDSATSRWLRSFWKPIEPRLPKLPRRTRSASKRFTSGASISPVRRLLMEAPEGVGSREREAQAPARRARPGGPLDARGEPKKMVNPRARREQIRSLGSRGLSQRRACGLLRVPRWTMGYRLRQPEKDAPALAAMHRLSSQYPRYDYRRIRVFLRRERLTIGINRARCLWRQAGLGLPRKRPRRRIAASRPRPLPPRAANHVWAYDFVFDSCANGQQLKCLTLVDEFTHECPAINVAGSIGSARVIDVLTRLMSHHGAPVYLRSDSGPGIRQPRDSAMADGRAH